MAPTNCGKQGIQYSSFIQIASEKISFSWGYAKLFPTAPLVFDYLKGLSHEIDLKNDDKNLQN